MRERKDMEFGRDLTARQAWSAYRRDIHVELVDSVTENRIRDGVAPPADDTGPG